MRLFEMHRDVDVSGVSGTGVVAQGVDFGDVAVIRWLGETPSTVVWNSIEDAMKIHGHGGATRFVWFDSVSSDIVHDAQVRADERAKWTRALATMLRKSTEHPHYVALLKAADWLDPTDRHMSARMRFDSSPIPG